MNAFTATPQVVGCCDQNLLFSAPRIAKYVFGTDDAAGDRAAAISIAWLKTLGVRFVAICGPRSDEFYHEIHHPAKFDGVLPKRWQAGDNTIFEIPGQTGSLAHWISPSEVITQMPANGIEVASLLPYADAVSDPARSQLSFSWTSTSDALVRSESAPVGNLLSIQIPYHSGWQAQDEGTVLIILCAIAWSVSLLSLRSSFQRASWTIHST